MVHNTQVIKGHELANTAASGQPPTPARGQGTLASTLSEDSVHGNNNGGMLVSSSSSYRLVEACARMLSSEFGALELNDRHKEVGAAKRTNSSIFTLIKTNLKRTWAQQNR